MTPTASVPSEPIVLVVTGGDPDLPVVLPEALALGSVVIAVDSGLDRLTGLGLHVDVVVGDLDSVSAEALADAVERGAVVTRYDADKDATDLELAIRVAVSHLERDPSLAGLHVVGAGGGRFDQTMGDLLALCSPHLRAWRVGASIGLATVTVVHPGPPRLVPGPIGDQVSILPVHGSARGVTTSGLRWALVDADLSAGTTRAMSNEIVEPTATATVAVGAGVLAVIQPGRPAAQVEARATPYDPTPRIGD